MVIAHYMSNMEKFARKKTGSPKDKQMPLKEDGQKATMCWDNYIDLSSWVT